MKDPMFDPSLTVGIPDHVVALLKESVVSAQKYGFASGSGMNTVVARMNEQKAKVSALLTALQAELSKRYEAGIEVGRNQFEESVRETKS